MIKGKLFPDRLGVLLLFGDDINRFEKKLIIGFRDNEIKQVVEYNSLQTEITVNLYPDGSEDDNNEEPVNTTYLKNELIEIAIETETNRALQHLQINYFEVNDYSWHQWIFARILKCYLSAQKVSEDDYPYKNFFLECFTDIVRKNIFLYEGIFGNQFNLKDVNKILSNIPPENKTGYQLKPVILFNNASRFIDGLVSYGFIDSKDVKNFKTFLNGKKPAEKIDWKKDLRFFVFLIIKLVGRDSHKNPIYLTVRPSKHWVQLYSMFSFEKEELPEKFNVRFNKLGKKPQQKITNLLEILLS